jgi:hypothetical protein
VYEERPWDVCLDLVNPENIIGIIERPTHGVLTLSDFIHHDTDEVTAGPAFSK